MKTHSLLILLSVVYCFSCTGNSPKEKQPPFHLIDKGDYSVSSHEGLMVFRLNETSKPMNGYYVVGDELVKWEEFEVKNGLLDGDYISFNKTGNIHSKTTYRQGKKYGLEEVFYDPSGKLKKQTFYGNNERPLSSKSYFESGQLMETTTYKDEALVESTSYDIIGNITQQSFLQEGLMVNQKIQEGKILFETISSTYDNYEAIKFYDEKGHLIMFLRMLDIDDKEKYLIELNEDGDEIKRINLVKNPNAINDYSKYFMMLK